MRSLRLRSDSRTGCQGNCRSDKGIYPSPELTKELQNHVKHTTAPYKYPRIIEYVDELPKTLGGKIKRAQIRKEDETAVKNS